MCDCGSIPRYYISFRVHVGIRKHRTGSIKGTGNLHKLSRERVTATSETHIVQIFDEPHDIFVSKLWDTIPCRRRYWRAGRETEVKACQDVQAIGGFCCVKPCRTGLGFVEAEESFMVNGMEGYVAGQSSTTCETRKYCMIVRK